jgi:hypothetical protein
MRVWHENQEYDKMMFANLLAVCPSVLPQKKVLTKQQMVGEDFPMLEEWFETLYEGC